MHVPTFVPVDWLIDWLIHVIAVPSKISLGVCIGLGVGNYGSLKGTLYRVPTCRLID